MPPAPTTPRRRKARSSASWRRTFESDTAAAAVADSVVGDQLDAGGIERRHQLHQRVDVAANDAVARLHALDGGKRQPRPLGERSLIDPEKRARGSELATGDHVYGIRIAIWNICCWC